MPTDTRSSAAPPPSSPARSFALYIRREALAFAYQVEDHVTIDNDSFGKGNYIVEVWGSHSWGGQGWIRTQMSAEDFERLYVRALEGPIAPAGQHPAPCTTRDLLGESR